MKLTIEDGRDSFYTFDTNRILLLTATDEEQINQVEFSTEENGETVSWTSDVLTGEDGIKYVQVPNEFLNGNYSRLVCYYVALDSKGEYTRQKEVFRIRARQEPEDYFLTYSERVTFASIKALTEQYKVNASNSADLARRYAEESEDVNVEAGTYSSKHWSAKSEKKFQEIKDYVGNSSNPESALGSIESARASAVSDVNKQKTDSIEAVGTYTSNTAIPSVSQYVDSTAKPALKTYGEQQVNAYIDGTSKPELDRYVNNEKKQVLDNYTAEKKSELDNYTETDKKQVLDSYTENEKKAELDSHTEGLKEQLNAHTVAKTGELNEYTTGLKSELDRYTTAKEQVISEFTEQKKLEVQGVYQNDLNELKGDLGYLRTHTKNIFEGDIVQGNINSSGADTDSIKDYFVRTDSYIPIDANVKVSGYPYYYFSLKCPMDAFYLYQYNSDKELIKSENAGIGLSNERKGFWKIIESNCSYVRFKIYHSDGATKCTPSDVSLVQIESGYEMTDYVYPYVAFDSVARNQSATNKADIATNKADIATNKADISEHTSSLSAYGLDLINLININTLTHGGYYTDTWNTAYNHSATDYIEVEEETDYCFQIFGSSSKKWMYSHPIVSYFDADKTHISWTNKATTDDYYTTPKNAKYCRVSNNTGLFGNMMMFKGIVSILNKYIPHRFDLVRQYFPWNLACGEIACIGDSLTAGLYAPISEGEILQGYPYYLRRILNSNVTVCAKSGGYPSAFYTGETGYSAYDFSKFDTIILWLGTNGGMSINDIDTDGTEANYYKKIIEGIKSQKSDIQIFLGRVFVTGPKGSETTYPTATQTNEVIDYFANLYSIPTIDFSDLTYLKYPHLHNYQENTHFGKLGNIYIANRIANFMQNYFEEDITRVEFGLLPKTSN